MSYCEMPLGIFYVYPKSVIRAFLVQKVRL